MENYIYSTESGTVEILMQNTGLLRLSNGYGDGQFSINITKNGGDYGRFMAEIVVASGDLVTIEGIELLNGKNSLFCKDGNITVFNEPLDNSDLEILDMFDLLTVTV